MKEIIDVCPVCEDERTIEIDTRKETQTIKNQQISAEIEYSKCRECGSEFSTAEQMKKNLEKFRQVYREKNDIVTPAEIKSLREEYGVSQKTLAKILDFGQLTINSYEQGSIPSGAHNNLFKLIRDPDNFLKLLEDSRERLTRTQVNKIDSHLNSMQKQLSFESIIYSHEVRELVNKESEYNGYSYTDIRKLFFTIQLILYYAQREVYKMAILKLLFYIDFSYFKKKEKSITGWPYANLPYGPVPEDYKRILFQGEEREMFFAEPDEIDKGEIYRLPDDFSAEGVLGYFSKEEIETIQEVVEKFGKRTASSLEKLTHSESAWKESAHANLISYHYASKLKAI
jgi:putative zinc finger/helix-turn-helix YgiT family protein